jgi:Conjugative transposon protein TcpC
MAAGQRVLPGPPVVQPMTTDHATAAVQDPIGPESLAHPPRGGRAAGSAKITGSLPAGVGMPAARAPARAWGGAGGRWLLWVFRVLAWTVLLVIGFRGVAAIVTGQPLAGGSAAGVQAVQRGFPVSLARAYALAFGQVYLNYNAATAAHRAAELATFLPPGVDPQLGWSRAGAQTLQFEQVAGVSVTDRHRAEVTLLAKVGGHLIEVGVPIYATSAGMVVSGHPAMLPPPSNIAVPAPSAITQDPSAKLALKRILPGFFRAYASGDAVQLAAYSPRGTVITGLGSVVAFGGLVRLVVPAATSPVRHIAVMVRWLPTGSAARPAGGSPSPSAGSPSPSASSPTPAVSARASVQMSYELTVVRHGSTWLVRAIGPASSQAWPSS